MGVIKTKHSETCRCEWCVDKLKAQISTLKAALEKHRWIPVGENLPEESGPYQVLRVENIYPSTRDYRKCDKTWGSMATITHWKPIALPEQKAK